MIFPGDFFLFNSENYQSDLFKIGNVFSYGFLENKL